MFAFDPAACFAGAPPAKRARSPSPPPPPPPPPPPVVPSLQTLNVGATPATRSLLPHEIFLRGGAPPPTASPPPPRAPLPHELFLRDGRAVPPLAAPLLIDLPMSVPSDAYVTSHACDVAVTSQACDVDVTSHAAVADADPRRAGCERYRSKWCPLAGLMREEGGVFGYVDPRRAQEVAEN